MGLLVQDYLLDHSLEDLEKEHGVEVSFHDDPYKFSLNYSQINSRNDDPLAQQCRGLILSTVDGSPANHGRALGSTAVLAYPMDRFFNYNQQEAIDIDWFKAVAEEKLDGTLCIVYYDRFVGRWCVATRRSPEANIPIDGFKEHTFRTLFERAFEDTFGSWKFSSNPFFMTDGHIPGESIAQFYTLCFELTTPVNRIVVDYKDYKVTLLFVRNNDTLQEITQDGWKHHHFFSNFPRPATWSLETLEACLQWAAERNPLESEGLVVREGTKRIKIKNPSYVFYNRARDELATSPRNCLQLVINEKADDVMPFLPEHIQERLQHIQDNFSTFLIFSDAMYHAADCLSGRELKTFAKILQLAEGQNKYLWPAPLFAIKRGKVTSTKAFIEASIKEGSVPNSILDSILQRLDL